MLQCWHRGTRLGFSLGSFLKKKECWGGFCEGIYTGILVILHCKGVQEHPKGFVILSETEQEDAMPRYCQQYERALWTPQKSCEFSTDFSFYKSKPGQMTLQKNRMVPISQSLFASWLQNKLRSTFLDTCRKLVSHIEMTTKNHGYRGYGKT